MKLLFLHFRLMCTEKLLEKFVEEYFYLNPISQIGIIVSFNKRAEKVSDMTGTQSIASYSRETSSNQSST